VLEDIVAMAHEFSSQKDRFTFKHKFLINFLCENPENRFMNLINPLLMNIEDFKTFLNEKVMPKLKLGESDFIKTEYKKLLTSMDTKVSLKSGSTKGRTK
jgi:hypothetical protein